MTMTDPIADMLTRVRNAIRVHHKDVALPTSKVKEAIAGVLKREGFIHDFAVEETSGSAWSSVQKTLRLKLKYDNDGVSAITKIERESKPGRRCYFSLADMPKVLGGLGVAVMSTPRGMLSDREARKERVGGEFICSVY